MPEKVFLSDILRTVGHLDFEFVQRGAEQNAVSKAGKSYSFWEYTVKSRSTGQQSVERLMKFDHLKMDRIQPGQLMRASLNDKGYVSWDAPPAGEAALAEPNNNFKEVQAERKYSEAVQDRNDDRLVHDFKLGLAGIVQAMLIKGCDDELITGVPHAQPKSAEEWVIWIRNKAQGMASDSNL